MLKEHLLTEVNNNVLIVTLNRPERLNAFSPDMISNLTKTITDVKHKPHIRAVVIKGAGRSFTAGSEIRLISRSWGYTAVV